MPTTPTRTVVLASLGGGIEFYDFVAYGIFAAAIAPAFFPAGDGTASLARTFAVFAGGYFIRPLGGIAFSHFGDRVGRRATFLVSLLGISLATLGMALCPTHASWGAPATLLFVALRLLQGFCLGGELPGAITYLVESVAVRRRGLACGTLFGCASLGVVLASGVNALLQALLPPGAVGDYGWRIAFALGGILGILSYLPRRMLIESPVFADLQRRRALQRVPLLLVVRKLGGPLAVGIATAAVVAGFNGLLFAFLPAYLARTGYAGGDIAAAVTVGLVANMLAVVTAGWLSDRVSAALVLRCGAGLLVVAAWPFFAAIAAGVGRGPMFLAGTLAGFGIVGGLTGGSFAVVLAGLFPPAARFSGVALAYNIAFAAFSGLAPVAALGLIAATGSLAAPALYLAGCAVVALFGSLWLAQWVPPEKPFWGA